MQKSTTSKPKESSPTPTNANKIHNNNSNLIERTKIEGTPFTMITQTMDNDKTKSFIVMGDHRLTEPTDTTEEQIEKLLTERWLIIANIIAITTAKMLQLREQHMTEALKGYRDGSLGEKEAIIAIKTGTFPYEIQSL